MNKKPGFWDNIHVYYGPEWDQDAPKECVEVHADGAKEVKCEFCDRNCGNSWCPYNKEEQ